jgi:aryl-phospho-beta-D-glucosidase BglC (GH1 family)
MHRLTRFIFSILALTAAVCATAAAVNSDVPSERLALLSRGVNLGNWFSQAPDGSAYHHDYLENWIQPAEFLALRNAGFRCIRFPVEFEMFFDEGHPDQLRPEFLGDFDAALDHMIHAGLAVIVDFHALDKTKERLLADDAYVARVSALWRAVALHLSNRDPNHVFLETMNEPLGDMPLPRWLSVQERFLAAIRSAAPQRTVIVTSDRWSSASELAKIQPLSDRNVVYTFHFYEPMTFTHQGASWIHGGEELISGLAYPVDPSNQNQVAEALSAPKAVALVRAYKANRALLASRIAAATGWGRTNGVPVFCGEFGAYTLRMPVDSRMRWIRDVREICEAEGVGWCMWDYCGGFHLALGKEPGRRLLDPVCLAALGLSPK